MRVVSNRFPPPQAQYIVAANRLRDIEKGGCAMARFQVRSNQRDKQTDSERIGSVIKVVEGAISAALREKNSLGLRVRNALDLAAIAMGNESDEWLTREKKDTSRIEGYEQQFIAGQARLDELETQIEGLRAVNELLRARFPVLPG